MSYLSLVPLRQNMQRVLIGILVILILIVLISGFNISGVFFQPLKTLRAIQRKKIHPVVSNNDLCYTEGVNHPIINWRIIRPNVNLMISVTGGFGNTIMAMALAFDACREHGIRSPTLIFERGGDFDFHEIVKPSFSTDGDDFPKSLCELFPWMNYSIVKSIGAPLVSLADSKIWTCRKSETFPVSLNVLQLTNYSKEMIPITDEGYSMVKQMVNPHIINYIKKNYQLEPGTMAVHLRLGQPTDDFIPLSPSAKNIIDFYNECKPTRILVFTDNKAMGEERMKSTGLEYTLVRDVNYVEYFLMSMCEHAMISDSTFSVSACRMGQMKNVQITTKNQVLKQNESWKVITP